MRQHRNITFSIPDDLRTSLYAHVSKRGISQFISNAILKTLEEEKLKKEQELDAAYEEANRDSDRLETLQDWNALDDVSDLIEDDEDWNWLRESTKKRKKLKHG